MQFRLRSLFIATAVIFAGLVAYDHLFRVWWVGRFPLQVHLVGPGHQRVSEVAADAVHAPKWMDRAGLDPKRLDSLELEDVSWKDGQPFTVDVSCCGQESALGRDVSYAHDELLVLRIHFVDGTSTYLYADIPDGRVAREVAVSVP
jgi:hypothetical protein